MENSEGNKNKPGWFDSIDWTSYLGQNSEIDQVNKHTERTPKVTRMTYE